MYDGVYRNGDVVRFARGSNEYVGTVVKIYGVIAGLRVRVVGDQEMNVNVRLKDVRQVVEPVLTEKERVAVVALKSLKSASVRGLRELGKPVYGTTLHGLAQRGLVTSLSVGIEGATARVTVWTLTGEGRRVAAGL